MARDRFTWLGADTYTRSYGAANSVFLEKGKDYDLGPIPPEVVDEWAKSGHAKWIGGSKPKTPVPATPEEV